jgi:hypothetical protein
MRYQLRYIRAPRTALPSVAKDDISRPEQDTTNPLLRHPWSQLR